MLAGQKKEGRKKEIVHDRIRGDNNIIVKPFNWNSGISFWPNLSPGLFFQAHEIMSQLICFNRKRGILDGDKTLALIWLWAKHGTRNNTFFFHFCFLFTTKWCETSYACNKTQEYRFYCTVDSPVVMTLALLKSSLCNFIQMFYVCSVYKPEKIKQIVQFIT